ncbi:MAG TPA: DEAD/DEAH box helicase [Bacteroidales bacterium]|nr:DEAD/DEAH box helicase [Bacteroidales bacterium]
MEASKAGERERLFILILTQHRRWGSVLMPYIIERTPGVSYYRMAESLSPHPDNATLSLLDNEESEIVRLVNEYSDRNLFKLFSKHSSVKEFLENIDAREFETLIKPYIEARISQCLHIALNEEVPVFLQKPKINSLHPEDRLRIIPQPATPVFRFDRGPEGSSYCLMIYSGGSPLNLRRGNVEILSNKPCVIRSNDRLFFVSDIEGAKLKPFLIRSNIVIPTATEEKYFGSFVLSVINSHKVSGTGFTIEEATPEKRAYLTIETGIRGIPVALLKFRYDDRDLFYPDDISHFTSFRADGGHFLFRRKKRDPAWEKKCIDSLGEAGLFSEDGITFTVAGARENDNDAFYELIEIIAHNKTRLTEAGFILRKGSLDVPYNLEPVEMTISHQLVNDWFDLKAVVTIGDYKIPFTRLRRNILEGIREYTLPDGTVAILPEEWFTRYRGLFEMGRDEDESLMVHKQHFSILSEALNAEECEICRKLEKLIMPEKLPLLEKPAGLNAEMRPYQSEGLNWLYFLQTNNLGGCLADDMGLGKTLQTLALLLWNKENQAISFNSNIEGQLSLFGSNTKKLTSLIIVPASLIHNWNNEIRKFCPSLKTLVHQGSGRMKTTSQFSRYDVVISSYHTVRQDIEFFSLFSFFYVVLDESQHIKNPSSRIYRAAIRIKAEHRLVLTGTPVENSLTDLWTQLSFINPGLLGSLAFFRREFAKPIEINNEEEREKRLKKIIQPFIMRRTKEMVAKELPPISEQVIFCDMDDEQAVIYEKEKSAVRNSILENIEAMGVEKSAIMVLQGLMKLRQIANHPRLTDETYQGGSGKFEAVIHNIESAISEGHKILIFSSFVKHLELFPAWLRSNGIGYSMLTGSTHDREKVIDAFRKDPSIKVFLISLKAGGVGLNLTEADYVFILDPWWNPASEIQALSRAHRIGQDKTVFVHRYISAATIEEKIQHLQERKSKLAEAFVESNNPMGNMDIRGILEIIS